MTDPECARGLTIDGTARVVGDDGALHVSAVHITALPVPGLSAVLWEITVDEGPPVPIVHRRQGRLWHALTAGPVHDDPESTGWPDRSSEAAD